jgi:hypothetical protein
LAKPAKPKLAAATPRRGTLPADPSPARGLDGARGTRPSETRRPSALVDTRVVYCGANLERLRKLPDACVDLIYIDPPFNSNRNYEVFWGETKEKRAFEDRHASTQAYLDYMRPRCVELARVLKKNRQLLLPLRLARLPLRQGHARPDFRGEQFHQRNRLETE